MKKILMMLMLAGAILGCSSTETKFGEMTVLESEPQYVLEDVGVVEKPLEDIIVFNEEGVVIRRDGNNLVLSMPVDILFDFDSYKVKESVKGSLDTLGKALAENRDIKIKIGGHTDYIGTEQYNLNLSLQRANSIKKYLTEKRVNPANISIEGHGKQNPVASNLTESGRAKNRRVEFIISRDKVVF